MTKPFPYTVVYDADAADKLAQVIKRKEEKEAAFNATDKLRRLGPQLAPPHMKSLQGAADLYELRPRQGTSPTRLTWTASRIDNLVPIKRASVTT